MRSVKKTHVTYCLTGQDIIEALNAKGIKAGEKITITVKTAPFTEPLKTELVTVEWEENS